MRSLLGLSCWLDCWLLKFKSKKIIIYWQKNVQNKHLSSWHIEWNFQEIKILEGANSHNFIQSVIYIHSFLTMYLAEKLTSVWPSLLHLAFLFLQITLCRSFIWEGSARGPAPSIYHFWKKRYTFRIHHIDSEWYPVTHLV